MDGSFLSGFSAGGTSFESVNVSHLLFADDNLILCEPDPNQIRSLRALLLCFEAVSGLKANLSKSELVPVGLVDHIRDLAEILGYKVSSLLMKYLGLPLGAFHQSKVIWDGVIQKIENRLAGWKRMYLSKRERITLIKSTLSNLPKYYLSLFPILASVANRMERFFPAFLWGGLGDPPPPQKKPLWWFGD